MKKSLLILCIVVLAYGSDRETCFKAYRSEIISKQELIKCLNKTDAKPEKNLENVHEESAAVKHNASGLYLSGRLPYQATRFVESFGCFDEDDRTMIYTYMLALEYRMEHVESMEDLEKSDLDYWRLWHIVSDIESACMLDYSFHGVLEELIAPTETDQKVLKKLRRVESGIRSDGSSELSKRMRQYDAGLRARVLANKPGYTVGPKDTDQRDYDLTSLKQLPENTIPDTVYDGIDTMETTRKNKDLLFRLAYLREETLRNYDRPEKRHAMQQEIVYLEECQRRLKLYPKRGERLNRKRKLAFSLSSYMHYYPLKTDFLPHEINAYCENNITAMTLAPVKVAAEEPTPQKSKMPVFAESQNYLQGYNGDPRTKTKMREYLTGITSAIGKQNGDIGMGLKLARLQDCIKKEPDFLQSVKNDIEREGIQEEFGEYVIQPMFWWATTIGMKIQQEGESEALKHFFDCNQTAPFVQQAVKSPPQTASKQHGFTRTQMGAGIEQKDNILKYYAKIFENRPSYYLNNKKAVEAGIIDDKWIDKNNKIIPAFGSSIRIEGMPQGGIKLTYQGIPGGELCSGFVYMNANDAIFFNNKTYEGIDYILLNNHKLRINHMVGKHVERLCGEREKNSVSFVKERTSKERQYSPIPIGSAFDVARKTEVLNTTAYGPSGFAHSDGSSIFFVSGQEAKIYDKQQKIYLGELPQELAYSYSPVMSPDGRILAVERYDKILLWDIFEERLLQKLDGPSGGANSLLRFLSDNKTLVTGAEKSLYLFNTENDKAIEITPKFIEKDKEFFTPRISAVGESPDGKTLYIGSSYGHVERWKKKGSYDDMDNVQITYLDTLEDRQVRDVGALSHDPRNPDRLIVCSGQKIRFWNLNKKSIIDTLDADINMQCKHLEFSSDLKYLMASSEYGVFLWKLGGKVQYEVLNGGDIKGAVFVDNNHIVTIGKEIALWKLEAN